MINCGHRGTGTNGPDNPYPENTIPSFAQAVTEGAQMIELEGTSSRPLTYQQATSCDPWRRILKSRRITTLILGGCLLGLLGLAIAGGSSVVSWCRGGVPAVPSSASSRVADASPQARRDPRTDAGAKVTDSPPATVCDRLGAAARLTRPPKLPRVSGKNVALVGQLGGKIIDTVIQDAVAFVGTRAGITARTLVQGSLRRLGTLPLGVTALASLPPYLLALDDRRAFWVIDVSNPRRMRPVAHLELPAKTWPLVALEKAAVVASEQCLLRIDLSQPRTPRIRGTLDLRRQTNGVVSSGARLYLTQSGLKSPDGLSRWLQVVEIKGARMRVIGEHHVSEDINALAAHKDLVLLGGSAGVTILDAGDPGRIRPISKLRTASTIVEIVASADRVVASTWWDDLYVIDLSDAKQPRLLAETQDVYNGRQLRLRGHQLLATSWNGLVTLDLSDPRKPVMQQFMTLLNGANALSKTGRYVAVALGENHGSAQGAWGGLGLVKVSDPARPELASYHDLAGRDDATIGRGVIASGNHVFVASGLCHFGMASCWGSLQVFRIGPGRSLTRRAQLSQRRRKRWALLGLALSGSDAILVGGSYEREGRQSGFMIADLRQPEQPSAVGSPGIANVGGPWYGYAVAVRGQHAFVAAGERGLSVLDIANRKAPRALKHHAIKGAGGRGTVNDVVLHGPHAFLAAGAAGLRVVDVSVPRQPRDVGHLALPGKALGLAVWRHYALVACGPAGLRVVDLTTPRAPREVGFFKPPLFFKAPLGMPGVGGVVDVIADSRRLYVLTTDSGLYVIRYTGP